MIEGRLYCGEIHCILFFATVRGACGITSRCARGPVGILAIGALGEVKGAEGQVDAEDGGPGVVIAPG